MCSPTSNNKPDEEDISSRKKKDSNQLEEVKPSRFTDLFRYASIKDVTILIIGVFFSIAMSATFPAINIIFGRLIDEIASPANQIEVMKDTLTVMILLAVYALCTFFLGFAFCGWAAARTANGFRTKFLDAVLRQDATFFDHSEPGSLSLMLNDSAFDIQNGLADKFASMIQGVFTIVFGFGVAFYYGPLLTLVLLSFSPFMMVIMTLLITWGSQDGIFGKSEYERAASIASEALSNVRTVFSLNAETEMSRRYDERLGESETAAVRQGKRTALLTGSLFAIMFCMEGVGFWFGAKLIADSTDEAIKAYPLPIDFPYDFEQSVTTSLYCNLYLDEKGTDDRTNAYDICACSLPWSILQTPFSNTTTSFRSPNCGCGYYDGIDSGPLFSTNAGCFSGGKTMLVFFSVLFGAFTAGQIGPGLSALTEARIAAAKMLKIIERYPVIDATSTKGKLRLNRNKNELKGEITFEEVKFHYQPKPNEDKSDEEKQRLVFGGCNLTIKAGETVALVGESGCGKSTIARLVQRFYDPSDGKILLDGIDLRDIAVADLRAHIGVVSQEPLLFDTSIEENIRYGKADATKAEIMQAAKSANAHTFISQFPDGYDTKVGPRGSKLSGGQKQRIAIARAILRNPPILILDEATSALDNKSEKIVQQALDKLVQDGQQRTTIVIAHRLSTVRNADKIVVLGSPDGTSIISTGSVVLEEGSHVELMQKENGFYKALVGAGERSSESEDQGSIEMEYSVEEVILQNDDEKNDSIEDDQISYWDKLRGKSKKKDEAAIAEVKLLKKKEKANNARVWKYSRPEMPLIIVGGIASMLKGSLFPLLSIAFSEMIIVWFDSDTDAIRRESFLWSLMFYGLALAFFLFEFLQKFLFEKVGERLTKRIRGDTFRAMLRQDITWFEDDKNDLGSLTSRLSTDVKLVRLVAGQSAAATLETLTALATGIAISLVASWEMFLVMFAIVPLLGISEYLNMTMLMNSEGSIRGEMTKSIDKLHETVNGIREVQAFSLERMVAKEIKFSLFDTVGPASRKAAMLKGFTMGMVQFIMFGVYAFAFWFGGKLIDDGRISFDDFNKALWAMAFAGSGLGQAAIFAGDSVKAKAAVKSIFDILDHSPDIDSKPWENMGLADPKKSTPVIRTLPKESLEQGTADLNKVQFAYPLRKGAKIFDNIDLNIPSGKVVALVGSSGSGKSTVVQLLERFYDPISYNEVTSNKETTMVADTGSNGIIKIDGIDMKELDCRWLRKNIGLVGQEPVLFNDTIYNNIALGKDGCTREEVEEAALSANAYDFITRLQDGFETVVGNAGTKVSGGQKQRIAIARAIVGKPKILLLDEATSALDNESEKIVQASLDALVKKSGGERTTIIIAHRLSTIQSADVICVLENNGSGSKVVEIGSHDELMSLGQKYYSLVQAYEK